MAARGSQGGFENSGRPQASPAITSPEFRHKPLGEEGIDVEDSQVAGGAFYPDTIAGWEKAAVITQGNVAALICANTEQDAAADAFRALFQ